MTRPIAAINGLQGFRYPLFLLGHCEKVSAVGLMCENSSNSDSTDAWIAVVNSAMTSKCHDSLGVSIERVCHCSVSGYVLGDRS
jgi:hypothetical protein